MVGSKFMGVGNRSTKVDGHNAFRFTTSSICMIIDMDIEYGLNLELKKWIRIYIYTINVLILQMIIIILKSSILDMF